MIEETEEAQGWIEVEGARVHNLKNIDVKIPRNQLVVITGLSGSGKSSLAFDTIFAEGQRRYIETFSQYARGFMSHFERPDVDKITGLSPVISIEQKTTNKNPRSTVGTTTEIYDFLRLLFARAGEAFSMATAEKMVKYSQQEIVNLIFETYAGRAIYILAPLVRGRKGHYKELFEGVTKKGYLHVRVDGQFREILPGMRLDRYKIHNIELVVDKLSISNQFIDRIESSINKAMKIGSGLLMICDKQSNEVRHYSKELMCPTSGISYSDPAPHNFSFNSPHGACPECKGLGIIHQMDRSKIIPDMKLSIKEGGILPLGKYRNVMFFWQLNALVNRAGHTLETPIEALEDELIDEILNGSDQPIQIKNSSLGDSKYSVSFDGVIKYLEILQDDTQASAASMRYIEQFISTITCPSCNGQRLKQESLHFKLAGKNIAQVAALDIDLLKEWLIELPQHLSSKQNQIATEILKELSTRVDFLLDVGLNYLSLNRASQSLSGGESQRIRLATQIGSQLVNVLYILDEPSIGLHQRDNIKLINSLKELRDSGNSVIVVEHDQQMMMEADYIVDLGPHAGRLGGEVIFAGTPSELHHADTLLAQYLTGRKAIEIPSIRRKGNGKHLLLEGATGHNLKGVDIKIPLGKLVCITGVSGSGKSTLINGTLQPILSQYYYRSNQKPLPYTRFEGYEHIDKVITVDQSPIGRTPRSNPATYTSIFADIRLLFVSLPESKIRGYKPGRFSFNVKGGRCEACQGNGYTTVEMNFLPNVYVPCEVCHTKRYNRETLEVRYKGKSIADILDMTIDQAVDFFESIPNIAFKIRMLQEVGLGYVKLGQSSTSLSGGENQRVKLAAELAKRDTGQTLYILDEPTTGLHMEDIRILLGVLNRLVDRGNSILVIEHNLDVIKVADHIIDMGPEGGSGGGYLLIEGTPEKVASSDVGYTSHFLQNELQGLSQHHF